MTFLTKLKKRFSRQEPRREIKFDDAGFSVFEDAGRKVHVVWSSVLEVFAYKDDLFTYDDICIGFRFDDAGTHWWVSEDYAGYRELVEELPRRFSGIRTDWFSDVAFPAFVHNRTTLWGEPWSPPSK